MLVKACMLVLTLAAFLGSATAAPPEAELAQGQETKSTPTRPDRPIVEPVIQRDEFGRLLATRVDDNTVFPEPESPTDVTLYYDDGIPFYRYDYITTSLYFGVKFSAGPGTVTQCKAYLARRDPSYTEEAYFQILSDNGGVPGSVLWTSGIVYIYDAAWYTANCNVNVTGPFYVFVYPSSFSSNWISQFSDGALNSPSGTQWYYYYGSYYQDPFGYCDLMIRAEFTGAASNPDLVIEKVSGVNPGTGHTGSSTFTLTVRNVGTVQYPAGTITFGTRETRPTMFSQVTQTVSTSAIPAGGTASFTLNAYTPQNTRPGPIEYTFNITGTSTSEPTSNNQTSVLIHYYDNTQVTQYYVNDNFNNGLTGWTIGGSGTLWDTTRLAFSFPHVTHPPTNPVRFSENHVATESKSGSYPNSDNVWLLCNAVINLTNAVNPFLVFSEKYQTESGYDYARVEFSTDGGSTWPITLLNRSGTSPSWPHWDTTRVSLASYVGQPNCRVRFRFTSDGSVVYDGWYIDDVIVAGGQLLPPTVTGVNPTFGSRLQTLSVDITGTNFVSVTGVSFGTGVTVNSYTVNSPTSITASITIASTAPTGGHDVSVTNGAGTGTLTNGFEVRNPAPTLTGTNPTWGNRLQTLNVTLTGSGYIQGTTTVSFGADITVNSVTVLSQNQLTANITISASAATGLRNVSVTNPAPGGGTATLTNIFEVRNPAPTLTSINPTWGSRLQTLDVQFNGSGYIQGTTAVSFGADVTVNSVTVLSQNQLTANITISASAATGLRNVTVSNPGPGGGAATLVNGFEVRNPEPTLTQIDPASGARLQTLDVTFTGSGYIDGVSSVAFGTDADITVNSVTVNSPTQLTANITIAQDAALTARDVSVTNSGPGGGTATLTGAFQVENPEPALTSIAPTSGERWWTGDVVFNGDYFLDGVSSVDFGADITVNSLTVNNRNRMTANITIDPAATTGARDVSVTNSGPGGGTAILTDGFEVRNPAPTLTSIDPTSGDQGWTGDIVFTGTKYLADASSVAFDPPDNITINSTTVDNENQITANITIDPAAVPGARDVSVTNSGPGGGTATLTDAFTVKLPVFNDVGATAIDVPSGTEYLNEEIFPRVKVKNYGEVPEPVVPVRVVITGPTDAEVYNEVKTISLGYNEEKTVTFEVGWTPADLGD
ncbi:MAG: hypothetical protein ABIL25_04990, partial [candidate division WOR-3 bacterium]